MVFFCFLCFVFIYFLLCILVAFGVVSVLDFAHSHKCTVVSHCFNLHFPDDILYYVQKLFICLFDICRSFFWCGFSKTLFLMSRRFYASFEKETNWFLSLKDTRFSENTINVSWELFLNLNCDCKYFDAHSHSPSI